MLTPQQKMDFMSPPQAQGQLMAGGPQSPWLGMQAQPEDPQMMYAQTQANPSQAAVAQSVRDAMKFNMPSPFGGGASGGGGMAAPGGTPSPTAEQPYMGFSNTISDRLKKIRSR